MQLREFRNEPLSDFRGNPEHARRMKAALEEVKQELGRQYDVVIGGERIKTEEKLCSFDPSEKSQVVGAFSKATPELADRAIRTADEAFKSWSRTPAETRVQLLLDTTKILRERKYYIAGWMVYEVGKTWAEAKAEVAEAIDFSDYYSFDNHCVSETQCYMTATG